MAVVALILGLFVVRPILAPSRLLPAPTTRDEENDDEIGELPMFGMAELPDLNDGGMAMMDQGDDPVQRLRQMISERENETIQILQDWIEDPATKEQA